MEYKFTLEEQKINRAKFIWKSCIEELERKDILTEEDTKNINEYINKEMQKQKNEGRISRYDREKRALSVSRVDDLVKDKIINDTQAKKLRKLLNKYDLSNLEE